MDLIESKNPRTGESLGSLPGLEVSDLPARIEAARVAQEKWSELSLRKRAKHLINLRETFLEHRDEILDLIVQENGKPRFEALSNEFIPSLSCLTFFASKGRRALKPQKISLGNGIALARKSTLHSVPLGVVGVITPWNYPLYLSIGDIAMNLIAGNAVVFKPSEITPLIGKKIQELVDEAGLPKNVLQTIQGDGKIGAALVSSGIDKIFFTGSVATGQKVWQSASKTMTPVNLELGGKDAMIVLADANLDFATSAALWGGYWNSGQNCSSIERLIIHESIARDFLELLQKKIRELRFNPSDSTDTDLGFITYENQKKTYETHLADAKEKGLRFLSGGEFRKDKTALEPTLVTGEKVETSLIFNEETFGPTLAATTFRSVHEAIEKCNNSEFGLLASIITKNTSLAEDMAKKIEVGTVTINEVGYTAGLPETPWGGVKKTGTGRKHSIQGIQECVHLRHVHKPRSFLPQVKSPWWFPYTKFQFETFLAFSDTFRKNPIARLMALPMFFWNLVQLFKNEKRL